MSGIAKTKSVKGPAAYANSYYDVPRVEGIVFTDGRIACGCNKGWAEPPAPREDIEAYMRGWAEHFKSSGNMQGLDDEYSVKIYKALLNNEHVTDEHGVLLPEFQRGSKP